MKIRDLLIAIFTGIGIGIPVTLICMISIGGWNPVVMEFLVWTIASALFGLMSLIFRSEKINPTLSTILHCIGCLLVTVSACTIIGYGNNFLEILLAIVPVFAIVYVVILVTGSISMKKNAKKANEALSKK